MLVWPSRVGDKVGLCDHDRFRGDALPFARVRRPADSLSTLHLRSYPPAGQDAVLTGG
jgi:hypothetical protein